MIKVEKGNVEGNGSGAMLLAELSGIIFSFREQDIASDEMILHAVNLGMKSRQEIHEKTMEIINKMPANILKDMMMEYFKGEDKK